ncbi:MAG: ATP-dependent helicase, partial [Mesorhizobium sp.]
STVVASEGEDDAPRRGKGAPRRAGRKDDDRKDHDRREKGGERKPRERHARHSEDAAPAAVRDEQPDVADAAVADIGERRVRKEAIRSENTERKSSDRNEQRAPERGDTRPQRDSNRPARQRHQEDNDSTVGFGDDMPAFMRIVAKV